MKVFRHNHEIENGRTSSITQHILGFDSAGHIANYSKGASPLRSVQLIIEPLFLFLSTLSSSPPTHLLNTMVGTPWLCCCFLGM